MNIFFTGSLRCLYCNSLFNENCSSTFQRMATVLCEDGEECATFVDSNYTVYRGCNSEMEDDVLGFKTCSNNDFCNNEKVCLNSPCLFCDDKDCDGQKKYHQSCIECESSEEDECRKVQTEQHTVTCINSHVNGCYHYEKGN